MIQKSNKVRRKGMILLVVVAFLALFSVMGVTYLIYADSQLRQSTDEVNGQDARQDSMRMVDLNPSFMLNFFLEKFLYDEADATRNPTTGVVVNPTPAGVYSAMRGHSLARNIYGWNDAPNALNDKPYVGAGKSNAPFALGASTYPQSSLVNHTFFAPSVTDGAPVKLDPQRGVRVNPTNPSPITEYWNGASTSVDSNNFYLGSLSVDSTTVIPSFYRQNIFGSTNKDSYSGGPLPAYPNFNNKWISADGKYLTTRPRPVDQLSAADQTAAGNNALALYNKTVQRISEGNLFPYPEADGADVKNLQGFPGGNDSFWMDVGSPVFTAPDGRKYKILIAPLILDLDGRVNLNVAGNMMQRDSATPNFTADHASSQGWGRWEINPKVLSQDNTNANPPTVQNNEFLNLLSYKTYSDTAASTATTDQSVNLKLPGRFRNNQYYLPPGGANPPTENIANQKPHAYAKVDFNAAGDDGTWGPSGKPDYSNASGFPIFPPSFGNASQSETSISSLGNYAYHAKYHNPYRITKDSNNVYSYCYPASETASLLRWVGTGDSYAKSALATTMPNTFGQDNPTDFTSTSLAVKARNRVTTVSADLDRPAMVPIIPDISSPYTNNFRIVNSMLFPEKVTPITVMMQTKYKPVADQPTAPNQTSPALKINLNRNLTNYPALIANNGMNDEGNYFDYLTNGATKTQFDKANKERNDFAKEIFETLRNVTGIIKLEDAQAALANMATPNADKMAITTDLVEIKKTNRWMAQLAANIVDYIDNDDFNTAFNWTTDPRDWVFGVELPRVVINETYTMAQNDSTDNFNMMKMATKDTHLFTAIELMNPLPQDANYGNGPGGHNAVLQFKDGPASTPTANYRVVLCKKGSISNQLNAVNGNYFNETGTHDFNGNNIAMDSNGAGKAILDEWSDTANPPMGNAIPGTWILGANNTNNATMVVTDDTALSMQADPKIGATLKSSKIKLKTINANQTPDDNNAPEIMLQKLVYPGLPHNDYLDPNNPGPLKNVNLPYNPYVTVDVYSKRKMYDLREYNDTAKVNPAPDVTKTNSYGRKAPYLDSSGMDSNNFANNMYNGANSTIQAPAAPGAGAQHTMGQSNSNIVNPLPWLVHLDRQLINPMELLHVSTGKPHELTQTANRWADSYNQPDDPANSIPGRVVSPYASTWPWYDENTRLYRLLEAVSVTPLQSGEIPHGRVLGKVNVNTMPDNVVFQAVADPSANNGFTNMDLVNSFNSLTSQRPISSFGQANNSDYSSSSSKLGLNKSLLGYTAFDSGNPMALENPNANYLDASNFSANGNSPAVYARKELLTKVANSLTTKSNVFGIWLTTGYFEADPTTNPPRLGAEIGKSEGTNIRHRMFAIVDRTQMTAMNSTLKYSTQSGPLSGFLKVDINNTPTNLFDSGTPAPNTNRAILAGDLVYGWQGGGTNSNGRTWAFQDKMVLTIEPNTQNEETVELKMNNSVNPARLEATFTKSHAYGSVIVNRGNPGPWAGYDRTKDKDVVIYSEIIE